MRTSGTVHVTLCLSTAWIVSTLLSILLGWSPHCCAFLLFSLDLGGWSDTNITTERQQRKSNDNISCSSTHLTTFAVLVDVSGLTNVRFIVSRV